uniref:exonuclease subunit SbcD n=1 Tax=Serratia liquefaciens TaxID=614 RepID=UPI0023629A19
MLRIIHSADWHIGQTLNGHAREHEHRAVLAELADIVRTREADALIVAGDIFDHQNPSGEAQAVYYE